MPKVVDHEQRRARLVEAVWALAIQSGLEGVTLRRVAAEAGVSMGQVQHYYPSMRELVRDALDRAVRALNAKIEASIGAVGAASPEVVLRECLHAVIALDDESVRLTRFALAVLGRTMSDPAMTPVLAPGDDELLAFTAGLITAARSERGSPLRGGERMDADISWSVATSLGVDIAIGHRSAEAARSLLDHHIERLLGPRRGEETG
ncbi:TetR/AcrR family transcriptional regulator [Sphaerisporangium sp. TRM90804]|uniref:TetR/AcrR family transcriptional regulator n=1 Tax=Sphaerisporangium sp. TRM90804 TaxID=3031113 RepID=UPI00244C4DBF|nr:TetR/AcrR family transcriptional regulator [Sphaerisporangium sp. TRM90804]MDH2426078.1 TetR family transcriptional regulator [Sphaerisporangium sp. TRM90804]